MEQASLVDEYGYVKDGKVFLAGYLGYPDRQIGEVKRTEQEALEYFKNRFNIAENKVNQLEIEVEEAQNKGSYLTKLVQLRKKLIDFDAIGNFIPLLNRLDELEVVLVELIRKNQLKNLEIKRALLSETEEVAGCSDWKMAAEKLQEIKIKWIKTGPVDKGQEPDIEPHFQALLDGFFQRRRDFFNEQNKVIQERLACYDNIIFQAERAVRHPDINEAYQIARRLNNEWKEVGEVPIKKSGKLFKRFRRATTAIFDKYNLSRGIVPKKRLDPRIEAQMKLCEEAERLVRQPNISVAAERAKELLNQWKEIKVPMKVADRELQDRFRSTCDKIFELNYLARVIARKYPAFELKSQVEQLRTRVREMEYLVRREKNDLALAISSMDSMDRAGVEVDKIAVGRINTQKRKIAMKEIILTEFNKELSTLE